MPRRLLRLFANTRATCHLLLNSGEAAFQMPNGHDNSDGRGIVVTGSHRRPGVPCGGPAGAVGGNPPPREHAKWPSLVTPACFWGGL
jgi:hypothetical protein